MHPYVIQAVAAERARDWQRQAALARRAKQARRARRGVAEVSAAQLAGRGQAREVGRVPQAGISELEGAARDHLDPLGAGRA